MAWPAARLPGRWVRDSGACARRGWEGSRSPLAGAQGQGQVRLCALIEPNKDGGAAANDVPATLRGRHSDGRRLPENPAGGSP